MGSRLTLAKSVHQLCTQRDMSVYKGTKGTATRTRKGDKVKFLVQIWNRDNRDGIEPPKEADKHNQDKDDDRNS